jgi:hypothetical protein
MTSTGIDKENWVALFTEIGLDEATMQRWHALFESRHPDGHQSFLEWLGLEAEELDRIRKSSREDWSE